MSDRERYLLKNLEVAEVGVKVSDEYRIIGDSEANAEMGMVCSLKNEPHLTL